MLVRINQTPEKCFAEAMSIALKTMCEFAEKHERPTLVRFVLFDRRTLDEYVQALRLVSEQRAGLSLE